MTTEHPLVAFIKARLDERARTSQGSGVVAWLSYRDDQGGMNYTTVAAISLETAEEDPTKAPWCAGGNLLAEPSSVCVIYDEREVRADIAAKRVILAEHHQEMPGKYGHDSPRCTVCLTSRGGWHEDWHADPWPCRTVRVLGAIWSDHPDYDPSWVPETEA